MLINIPSKVLFWQLITPSYVYDKRLAAPSRSRRFLQRSGVFLLLILLSRLAIAQPQTAFDYGSGISYLFREITTNIYKIDLTTGEATALTTAGIPLTSNGTSMAATRLNSFGFNPKDKYIWGQVYGQSQIVRIGSEYTGQVFSVSNLPPNPYVVGDVSPSGIMYLAVGGSNATNVIYAIDLNQPATALSAIALPTTASFIADWAVSPIDGNLYAVYSSLANQTPMLTLYRFLAADRTNADGSVDLAGTRDVLGELTGGSINTSNFGSAFMDNSGSFYVINTRGSIYRIDNPHNLPVNGSPRAYYVAKPVVAPDANNADGARCANSKVVPLPVTLTSFTATTTASHGVQLSWAIASEWNNAFFEVQHSFDGQLFTAIGQVSGHQTTGQASVYPFVHATPGITATHYYRLRQVDLDGTAIYSPVRVVKWSALQVNDLRYYPNPMQGQLTLDLTNWPADPCTIELLDLAGRSHYAQGQVQQLQLSSLAVGTYVLRVHGPDQMQTRLLVQQ